MQYFVYKSSKKFRRNTIGCSFLMGGIKILKLINKFFKKEEEQSLNEFLNVKNIKESILYTLDGQVIQFIKVEPINIEKSK